MKYFFLLLVLATAAACGIEPNPAAKNDNTEKLSAKDTTAAEPEAFEKEMHKSMEFLEHRDLDGDEKDDLISFDFTEGAHCCYRLHVSLSSVNKEQAFPFNMDGDYVWGVDGSQPEHFNIADFDNDGLEEIFMEIETYNGELSPIPKAWQEEYGISTHYILVDFKDGKLKVYDFN